MIAMITEKILSVCIRFFSKIGFKKAKPKQAKARPSPGKKNKIVDFNTEDCVEVYHIIDKIDNSETVYKIKAGPIVLNLKSEEEAKYLLSFLKGMGKDK